MKTWKYLPKSLLIAAAAVFAVSSAAAPATRPAAPPRAAEAPAQPQRAVYRVTGLFSPDREADLRAALKQIPGVELASLDFDHAEGTFAFEAAKAFPGTKPEKIAERFDQLLRTATRSTFGIKPLSTTPREQLTRVEISIRGLDCKACCLAVYEMVAKEDGVEQATASFKDQRMTALIDPRKTSKAVLKAVLKKREVPVGDP